MAARPGYTEKMKAFRPTLFALACCLPLVASAQWQWVDQSGRKVFSDTPPPASVPDDRIVRRPGQRAASIPEPAAAATPVAAANATAPRPSGKDGALEEKKKQAEAAEAEKKKAEEEKLAQLQADNCRRAKAGKTDYTSGMRIARINAQGEREILDDKQRAAEVSRLDDIIARDCKAAQ